MCSTQEPRETSLEEKGVFLDQAPREGQQSTFVCPEVMAETSPVVGAPRPQAEPRSLSKGSAQSYGDDHSTLSPEGAGVGA